MTMRCLTLNKRFMTGDLEPYSDEVVPGDLLLGYENSRGDPSLTGRLWDDSTFLVVRKLKQEVGVLRDVLKESKLKPEDLKAKFMGRTGDGQILLEDETIKNRKGNDFNYSKDPEGKACPFQSHIRRANPRRTRDDVRTVPGSCDAACPMAHPSMRTRSPNAACFSWRTTRRSRSSSRSSRRG